MRPLLCTLLAALTLGLVVTGCGDSEDNPTSKALGAKSEQDKETIKDLFTQLKDFPHANARFARAAQQEDVPAAQDAVDEMDKLLDEGERTALKLESDKSQKIVDDYLGALRPLVTAYQRLLTAAQDPATKKATMRRILADLQDAALKARAADREFISRIRAVLPKDERDEFTKELDKRLQRLKQESTP